jgi:ribosome-associated protein
MIKKKKSHKPVRAHRGGRGKPQRSEKPATRSIERGGVPAPRTPRADPNRGVAMAIAQAGLDKKAEDVLLLDVRGLTSYADYFVVMTADSERQASAIADHVDDVLAESGNRKVGVEGQGTGQWVLLDFGDVVAHVFNRDARAFYDLEGLWADAPKLRVTG